MNKVVIFLVLFLALPFASAELLFTQPNTAYNFGDELSVTLTIHPASATTDFARIDLICDQGAVTLHSSLLSVSGGSQRDIVLNPQLDSPLFGEMEGQCYLHGLFGDEETNSQSFILTRDITTEITVPTTIVLPGSSITVSGTARKANGQQLAGFARLVIEGTDFSVTHTVSNGAFSFNATLPRNLAPGERLLHVETYEENEEGVVINEGRATSEIIVQVVLTRADIVFETRDATPGRPFAFTLHAYDQADNALERDARYDIYAPNVESAHTTNLIKTGTPTKFEVESSAVPGYWRVEATVGTVTAKKLFYVNEQELVTFSIENNNTLIVTNEGNVPYNKDVEIKIGEYSSIKKINLEVGDAARFSLRAPDAQYNISVQDGNRSFLAQGVPLTGRAIDIGEVSGSFFNLWWAGVFILAIASLTFLTNVYIARKKNRSSRIPSSTSVSSSVVSRKINSTGIGIPSGATREPATVIALRVDSDSALARNALDEALGIAHQAGASVTSNMGQHLVAFSPRFTKKLENDLLAVQVAKEIASTLKGSNQEGTFDFGIGVSKGEIITHPERPGQFTSVGNVIPTAKRLAHSSKREVLISDELHGVLRTSVKSEKVAGTNNAWRVNSILSRESHKSFIDSFLKRQKK